MSAIACSNCRRAYPAEGTPYRCPTCGGTYDLVELPPYDAAAVQAGQPGIWRYRAMFGLEDGSPVVSLGEGATPLVWAEAHGRQIGFKCEYHNPSGSYKDRGAATLVSFLRGRGATQAIEDSSGNAGAAFAAYAARAGMQARVYIPDSASGPKRSQIQAYGAEVVRILGNRAAAAEKARQQAKAGAVYASHAYLPHVLPGYATIAYELFEQLGGCPGTVLSPVGQGNLLLAVGRGFAALQRAGLIERLPALVGVQAQACAPLWALASYGPAGLGWVTEGLTLAEGVRVRYPTRGDAVLQMVEASGGRFLAVDEAQILPGRDELARRGLYVEPTSALVWDALAQAAGGLPEPLVVILTGSGLKYAG
jgi:threonine synthase